jgi:hypothetical protein
MPEFFMTGLLVLQRHGSGTESGRYDTSGDRSKTCVEN